MNKSKPSASPSSNGEKSENTAGASAAEQTPRVDYILHQISRTLSAMKLFPADHNIVSGLFGKLWGEIHAFLEENWKLEIGVEEDSFLFEEKIVYQEKHPRRSLPFLFYKDGIQMLFFYKGLSRAEFWDFLNTLRTDALLPPEESDIVLSLWKKDFPDIRYFAPDEFLEAKIGTGKEHISPSVDKNILNTGRIELDGEDKDLLERSRQEDSLGIADLDQNLPKPGGEAISNADLAESGFLNEKDLAEIEAMVLSNGKLREDEDFVNVALEILSLEERVESFTRILAILGKHHQHLVQNADIVSDHLLLTRIRDIRALYPPEDEKAQLLENFLRFSYDAAAVKALKKAVLTGQISDNALFFRYLRLLGWIAVPTVADLYEEKDDGPFREMAAVFLSELGREHLQAFCRLAQDTKPILAKLIISCLGQVESAKSLPYLSAFSQSQDATIRAAAIAALGTLSGEEVNRALIGFLDDQSPGNRIAAALNLRLPQSVDHPTMERLLEVVRRPDFSKKSKEEKSAILGFLAKSRDPKILESLTQALRRRKIFMKAVPLETVRCAVDALARANTSQAKDILRSIAKFGSKEIRSEALAALEHLPDPPL